MRINNQMLHEGMLSIFKGEGKFETWTTPLGRARLEAVLAMTDLIAENISVEEAADKIKWAVIDFKHELKTHLGYDDHRELYHRKKDAIDSFIDALGGNPNLIK